MFGLTEEDLGRIRTTLQAFPQIETAQIIGSRAMGNYKKGSDIDLVLTGDVPFQVVAKVKTALEELPTPYFFDVIVYQDVKNASLKMHIDTHGKIFYRKVN